MSDASDSLQPLFLLEREIAEAEAAIAQEEVRVHAELSALPADPAAERARQILQRLVAIEAGSFDVTHLKTAAMAQVQAAQGAALSERQAAVVARRTALEARRRALQAKSEAAARLAATSATRLAEVESLDTTVTLLESALARAADRARQEREEAARNEAAQVEAARLEAQRQEAQQSEAARVEAARVEAARVEAARVEAARVEAARVEAARVEAALEAEREEARIAEARVAEARLAEELQGEAAVPATQVEVNTVGEVQVEQAQAMESATIDTPPPSVAGPANSLSKSPVRKASRRKRVRLAPPPSRLEVEVATFGDTNFFTGFDRSLSSGGVFVETFHNLPVGHELDVELSLSGRKIQTRARVAFVRDISLANTESTPGAGLALLDVSEEERAVIEAFFEKREPLFFVSPTRNAA